MPFHNILLCVLSVLLFSSCGMLRNYTAKEVIGEYAYTYATGEVEVWKLSDGLNYEQDLFRSAADWRAGTNIIYSNFGHWSFERNRVSIIDALNFFDFTKQGHVIAKPQHLTFQSGLWIPSEKQEDAKILVGEDIGYVLRRTHEHDH